MDEGSLLFNPHSTNHPAAIDVMYGKVKNLILDWIGRFCCLASSGMGNDRSVTDLNFSSVVVTSFKFFIESDIIDILFPLVVPSTFIV